MGLGRRSSPDLSHELAFAAECGSILVAGLDEAGRGALAGPVFAAAVILPLDDPAIASALGDVDDSKQLSPAARLRLFPVICSWAFAFGVGSAPAAIIDSIGIVPATRLAMGEALRQLPVVAEALLIDGPLRLPALPLRQRSVVRGDQVSLSVAAASILAKVSRDRYMTDLGTRLPQYGFGRHKGYGTAAHLAALARYGPSAEHRRSFAPLRG